ncbi:rhomboid family intramembrane serine protease [Rapidithrix thailandica]|uniref:Rhomboid family intramembrane serine protease n=1 Tax=Rapidithrix thailandica TaxID=413964 RepID=A0AAW9S8C0_9BACT
MTLSKSIRLPLSVVCVYWLIEVVEYNLQLDLGHWGILPRSFVGLPGILLSPFLHGNFNHLLSNTPTFIVLGGSILFFYPAIYKKIILYTYLMTGIGVWLFAREAYHIGASGLIYGFASFLFFSGIFRKDLKSLTISVVVALLYGGMVYGIFPNQPGVSWESHFIGGLVGAFLAYFYKDHLQMDEQIEDYDYPEIDTDEGYLNMENSMYKYVYKEKQNTSEKSH